MGILNSSERIWRDRAFVVGLTAKLLIVIIVAPDLQSQWFLPFLQATIQHPSYSPWTSFLEAGGDPLAFPYGITMLAAHLPTVFLGTLVDAWVGGHEFAGIGFRLSLLAADLIVLFMILDLVGKQQKAVIWLYWYSPIAIYVTYWHGQTDVVPVALLLAALVALKRFRPIMAGVSVGFAVSAKLSMLLTVPFLLVYLFSNRRFRHLFTPFTVALMAILIFFQLPFMFTAGFQQMVMGSPEIDKIYRLAVSLSDDVAIFLTPAVYLVTLYAAWRVGRMNLELLLQVIGVAFFVVVLMTPASVGWFIWTVPFLAVHVMRAGTVSIVLVTLFSAMLTTYHFAFSSGASLAFSGTFVPLWDVDLTNMSNLAQIKSLFMTVITSVGVMLAVQMYREGIGQNDFYRLSRKPLVLALGGDEGMVKRELGEVLGGLFGTQSVTNLNTDDYRLWESSAPMWSAVTPWNPRSTDLYKFSEDVMSLVAGKPVYCRRYSSESGRFSSVQRVHANDVVVVSGLHPFFAPVVAKNYDVGVFVEVEEPRSAESPRVINDLGIENVPGPFLASTSADYTRYIAPQSKAADLVFFIPSSKSGSDTVNSSSMHSAMLNVLIREGLYYEKMARVLIGVCGLRLDVKLQEDLSMVEMSIEGELSADDVRLATTMVAPEIDEILAPEPHWRGGTLGLMQLFVLTHVDQSLRGRS